VVVTVNHRLAAFGYLQLAGLAGMPSDLADAGAVGVADMVASLKWVQANIAGFGGDPDRVMIFGQSGGGSKVSTLLATPSAKGLFHRAAIQSGSTLRQQTPDQGAKSAALLVADALTVAAVPGAAWLAESALTVTAALTAVLALGVAAVVRRGTRARCACFGARSGRPIGRTHLARNVSLLAVVCAGLVAVPLASRLPSLPGAVLAAATGAVTALLFARWDDIAALFAPPATAVRRES